MINKFQNQKEVTENNKIIRKKTYFSSLVVAKIFQQEATILKLSKKTVSKSKKQ